MESTKRFFFFSTFSDRYLQRKKLFDENSSVVRILFWEKVAALHWLALRLRRPLPPNAERTTVFCIESVERTALGP